MVPQDVCPFCGQPLIKREAIDHLRRAQAQFERRLRQEAERELRPRLRSQLVEEIRKELADEYKRKQRDDAEAIDAKYRSRLERQARENERLREQVEQMRRRIERMDAGERGELSEEDLLRSLQRAFPSDDIKPVGRGRAGADIIHKVREKTDGGLAEAGVIVYESKDTLKWQEGFVAQAKEARERYSTPHVVVVSRAFPKRERGLSWRDGVPVVHPAHAVPLAHVIRRFIVQMHRAGLSTQDAARKSEELYTYIRSADFQRCLSDIVERSKNLTELLGAEKRQHAKLWTRREQAYYALERRAIEIEEAIRAIVERGATRYGRKKIAHRRRVRVRVR